MNQRERRIRRLRLVSSEARLLPAARHQLEEAFRLASLPGLPPNALVLIRQLDLGSIRPDMPPWLLAARIGDLVRELAGQAVCVDRLPATAAPVVWFSDPLQPFMTLLHRLLDNGVATEWYWRSVFPGRRLVLADATIEMLLAGAGETPLKALGQGLLVQSCLALSRRDCLFSLITRPMAACLLNDLGLLSMDGGRETQPDARETVAIVSDAGGPPDALPPRQDAVSAPDLPLPWRAALQWAQRNWGVRDERSVWLACHALLCHRPAYLIRPGVLKRIALADWLAHWSSAKPTGKRESGHVAASQPSTARLRSVHPVADKTPGEAVDRKDLSPPESNVRTDMRDGSGNGDGNRADARRPGVAEPPSVFLAEAGSLTSEATACPDGSGIFSRHAGFALLIPLLNRLGMAELLAENEFLVELDFPARLLSAFADRFRLTEDDPCRALWGRPVSAASPVIDEFCAPASWWRMASATGRPLRRLWLARGHGRMIVAPGGRWLLGVGDVMAMMAGSGPVATISSDGMTKRSVRLDDVLVSMQLVAALFLRRCCAMSLRTLLSRPGRVVLTPTHWDVILDLNQIDLRLRRAALDSDPGWVAWLGKVVQFHYHARR